MHSYLHRLRHRRRPRDWRTQARRLGATLAAAIGLALNVPPSASGDLGEALYLLQGGPVDALLGRPARRHP